MATLSEEGSGCSNLKKNAILEVPPLHDPYIVVLPYYMTSK